MKKLLTIGLLVASTLWMVGLAAIIAVPVQAASAGDLIKVSTSKAVYYLGEDSKRYIFPNQATYMTWYSDFSGVQTISQSEIEGMTIGGNVTFRPGTKLIKFPTVAKVYAVEPGGVLRHVTSEAIATSLYGAEWYNEVGEVPEENFIAYTEGSDITDATYPTGTLVQEQGGSTIYYIEDGEKRPVADETAFNANLFSWGDVLTASSLAAYTAGTSITGAEGAIANIDGAEATAPVTSTGTLTVSLSSDTPAANTIVKNATFVKFTKVNFTASGGDVEVDSLVIKRGGLAQDSNFSYVFLLDKDENMFGNEKTLGSLHTASVNDDFTVKNGETVSYWISATMYSTLQAGEVATLGVSAVKVKGDASVSATFPVEGNGMTMNNTITIGTATQAAGSTNPTSATKQVGLTDYVFASAKLTINSTENAQVERIRWYQSGTAADADLANLDLVVDGVVLATVAKPNDKEVIFDLSSSPYSIAKGQDKTFEIRGDIVDGSSRTIEFEFSELTDIKVLGKTYGFYITPTYVTSQISSPYWNNTAVTTISTGTLVVSKKVLSDIYVSEGSTQAVVGAFNFRTNGEPVIITALHIRMVTSTEGNTGGITNVSLYDEDDNVVAGPVDPTEQDNDEGSANFTDTFTVPTGEHIYYVKADLDSNFTTGDTITCSINSPASSATAADEITAKGEVTNNTIYPTPYSQVSADQMTVRAGKLSVSTQNTPVAQTVVAGATAVEFANFVLDASGSGEDIKVTQLTIRHSTTAADIHQDISNMKVYNGTALLNGSDVENGTSSTTNSKSTTTIDLDEALIITKGKNVTLTLKANVSGSAAADSGHEFSMVGTSALVAYGNSTGNSITETITNSDGQQMTIASNANLTIGVSSASAISDALVAGNTDGITVGVFNFRAQYNDINLEEVYLLITAVNSGGPDQFGKVYLYDGAIKVAEAVATTTDATVGASTQLHLDMSDAPVLIAKGTTKDLTVKVDTSDADYYNFGVSSKGASGAGFKFTINATGDVVARSNGLLAAGNKTLNAAALKQYYLYKSVPTVLTNDKLPTTQCGSDCPIVSGALLAGTTSGKELYKFNVRANAAADVALAKVSFLVTTSTATATSFYLYEGGTQKAATTTYLNVSAGKFIVEFLFTSDGTAPDAGEVDGKAAIITKNTTRTYTFKADVEGPSGTTTGSVQVQFLGDGTVASTNPAGYGPGAATNLRAQTYESNFIWGDLWRTFDVSSTTASSTEQWVNGYLVPTGATTVLQATSSAVTFSK